MAEGRHSFVAFYPSDWIGGTARMTRLQRSVYFDICCYNWDKAEDCPLSELALMLGDIDGWQGIVDLLVAAGKLYRTPDGSLGSTKAMSEAKKAFDLWAKKSKGGKAGANKTNSGSGDGTPDSTPAKTPVGSVPGVPSQNQNQNQNLIKDAQGASSQPKRERKATSHLPEDCPTESDRVAALQFWRGRGREDLCARLSDEAAAFRAHHAAHGKRMADWSAAWRTWYGNAMRFNQAPKGSVAAFKPPPRHFDDTTREKWAERMQVYGRSKLWPSNWGPRPGEPGCLCPIDIITAKEDAA